MINPLWLAVDTADPRQARALVAACAPHLGGVKLGLEFFVANGPEGVRGAMAGVGLPLFLDLKLHDIPHTVARAVAAAAALAPALLTVHAAGGPAMIAAARGAAPPATRIIAVSVLTSLDDEDLRAAGVAGGAMAQVVRLAGLARDAGADGLVCSPQEVAEVARRWPGGFLVVPGIRAEGDGHADQKRVMAPRAALAAGASALVVGRPISRADDPAAAAAAIAALLRG
jgi:orotidine-5'-phosphate decarboxylase